MYPFEKICRPILFEAEGYYSYYGKGSSVLVKSSSFSYCITAKHVVDKLRGTSESIRILPSDESRKSIPFDECTTIPEAPNDEDYDYKDLYILRIDLSEFKISGDAQIIAYDLESGVLDPNCLKPDEELFIIGYPSEYSDIDYEKSKIKGKRVAVKGLFAGTGISKHCFKIIIDPAVNLNSFDGLSGSPVFVFREKQPKLVGLVLRGTVESKIIHFVGSHVIANAIHFAEAT